MNSHIVAEQLHRMFGFTEAKSAQRHAMPGVPFDSQGGGVIPGASGDLLQFQASLQTLRDQGLPKRAARLKANMFASMYGTDLSKL